MDTLDLSAEGRKGFKLYRKTDVEPEYYEYVDVSQAEINCIVDNIQRAVDQHSSLLYGDLFRAGWKDGADYTDMDVETYERFTWRELQLKRNKMWEF